MKTLTDILKYIPAVLWSGIIFIVCLLPGSSLPKDPFLEKIHFDKIVHFSVYILLFLLLIYGLKQNFLKKKRIYIASLICISQGIIIEFLQGSTFVKGRSFELLDVVANVSGVIAGILLIYRKHKTN